MRVHENRKSNSSCIRTLGKGVAFQKRKHHACKGIKKGSKRTIPDIICHQPNQAFLMFLSGVNFEHENKTSQRPQNVPRSEITITIIIIIIIITMSSSSNSSSSTSSSSSSPKLRNSSSASTVWRFGREIYFACFQAIFPSHNLWTKVSFVKRGKLAKTYRLPFHEMIQKSLIIIESNQKNLVAAHYLVL